MTFDVTTTDPGLRCPVIASGGLAEAAIDYTAGQGAELAIKGSYLIVCFGLDRKKVRRQPWHVAMGLARGLAANGHQVSILTDSDDPPYDNKVECLSFDRLVEKGRWSPALFDHLKDQSPDRIFMITGPTELARLRKFATETPVSLIMASPRLNAGHFIKLGFQSLWEERDLLFRPLINAMIPGIFLKWGYRRSGADQIIYLSKEACQAFASLGLPQGPVLRPQIHERRWPAPPQTARKRVTYFGPPLEIRGAFTALTAFERAAEMGLDGELDLIIRPDGQRDRSRELIERAAKSRVANRIHVECRYLDPDQLMQRLSCAHIFLLPFKMTVSDVPLVVIEAGLSGRQLIVLDAPGVGDTARELGGLVARNQAELPRYLVQAAKERQRPDVRKDGWCDWRAKSEEVLRYNPGIHPDWRMIGVCGVDGAGKTALVRAMQEILDKGGYPNRHLWSRFRNYLSKPLLAIARLTGHNHKEHHGRITVGYHDFDFKNRLARILIGRPFILLQLIDAWMDFKWRSMGSAGHILVADRCILDTLVDLAVDTGEDDLILGRLGRFFLQTLPQPNFTIIIERDTGAIKESRPDVFLDRHFARRRALYHRIARDWRLPVIRNDRPLAIVAEDLIRQLRTPPRTATPHAAFSSIPSFKETHE